MKINAGELRPGMQLPSERTLATDYGVARNTVKAAMQILAEAGMVIRNHGKGVFVRTPEPLIRLGSDRYSPKYRESGLSPFLIECERAGKRGRFEVLSTDRAEPPHDVAERVHVDEEAPSVLRRENVFWADDAHFAAVLRPLTQPTIYKTPADLLNLALRLESLATVEASFIGSLVETVPGPWSAGPAQSRP